jgi:peptidylprolyl isomerase
MSKISLHTSIAFALIVLVGQPSFAASKGKTMQEIIDASTAADWRTVDPENVVYLELASGRVVIELAPQFAPEHSANIRMLAVEGYWNGLSINRSQDNFVVQWGDAAEDPKLAKSLGTAKEKLPAEFAVNNFDKKNFHALPDSDGWSKHAGFVQGFPAATDGKQTWLTHCYAAVGAGRSNEPDSSNGTELYVVIGQSPRQLDRNITVVGRVLQGMEFLSILQRGTGPLGFYEKAEQRTAIKAILLAANVPESEQTHLEVFRTDTNTFDELVEARRNRKDDWYLNKAGHIDVCNVPIPVRMKK